MPYRASSEHTCGSTPFDEFGCVDSTPHSQFVSFGGDCPTCGVSFGFGGCHICLAIACEAFRNEDYLDEL